uniref:Uncharacterized protein LOC101309846 n=1 Tax=Rhizophora mucronata TaxID=61149 RepID=A0A2P2KP72_RHIMU
MEQYTKPSCSNGKEKMSVKEIVAIQRHIKTNCRSSSNNKFKQKLQIRIQLLAYETSPIGRSSELAPIFLASFNVWYRQDSRIQSSMDCIGISAGINGEPGQVKDRLRRPPNELIFRIRDSSTDVNVDGAFLLL